MKKKVLAILLAAACVGVLAAGCGKQEAATSAAPEGSAPTEAAEEVTLNMSAAKSLNGVMEEVIAEYNKTHPEVKIVGNYDSSGTLMEQIKQNAGADCDIFFSAAQKQMDELEAEDLVVADTRTNVVNNQLVVVKAKDADTACEGIESLDKASNMALADGSVPIGQYTRKALMTLGILPESDDPKAVSTEEVSKALGGLEINECANVGAVTSAVAEGSNEVGTVYLSDTYGMEDKLDIIETVSYDITGDVIYPIAQIANPNATDAQKAATADFIKFVKSDEAKAIFDKYLFDTDVE